MRNATLQLNQALEISGGALWSWETQRRFVSSMVIARG
jgi:hypothetical protein